ncbi:phosphomannomutase [Guyparkeria hydrothermalis]|uniref:phosphomannomutase n=1 Tax=Guyparkeria hydrothermalis TaxID=923 RepID=UPI0020205AF7|nr:phosphomannomutase [Guyparkeria hydrothermalis]MCL7745485.1 phosphomannomutase [Guyparkeria hydrothermalis]
MHGESNVQAILGKSQIEFGTSGARGLVEQFTDEVCAAFTTAFLVVMREQAEVTHVAIGMDRRPSSPAMAAACSAAARALGVKVVDYGVLPTPALALQAMADGVPAIMITGSHIPFDRNGIKFYRPEGEITKADERAIMSVAAELPALGESLRETVSDAAKQRYFSRYAEWFPGQPLSGRRIGLYQHSAAGRDLSQEVLEGLGAQVIALGRSEEFVPVDTEAVSDEDRALARDWAAEHQLDALLTTDGDGDRPLLADEQGVWLRGDITGLLCARELGIQALAVPVSCNTAIEGCNAFDEVLRTRIGSPYVLAGMEGLAGKHLRVAGFEANGGFLLGTPVEEGDRRLDPLPTRDALLPALTLMVAAAREDKPLSALVDGLPARYTASDRLKAFPTEHSQALLAEWRADLAAMQQALGLEPAVSRIDDTDGLRAVMANGEVVHLRPSGNAPELRCYAESDCPNRAEALVANVLERLVR